MKHKGYDDALNLAYEQLKKKDPQELAENTGCIWNGTDFEIPWFGKLIKLEEGDKEERILWLHYLLGSGSKTPRGVYINYKQVPGAIIYNDVFVKRAINPMVKVFSNNLDEFLKRGQALGGEKVSIGHMAFTMKPLPHLPVTCVIWQGDEEVPAEGNILFDETAIEWLCAEDLVVLASLPVYKMMKNNDSRYFNIK